MSLSRINSRLGGILELIKKGGAATAEAKLDAIRAEVLEIRAMVGEELLIQEDEDRVVDQDSVEEYGRVLEVVRQSRVDTFKTYYDQDYFDELSTKSQWLLGKALLEFCSERAIKPLQIWINYGSR